MIKIAEMYITLLPVILAGIMNMVWCKIKVCDFLRKPVDFGKNFTDGRRIFGDNKTFKGFAGMIVFGAVFTVLWGLVSRPGTFAAEHNYFYRYYDEIDQLDDDLLRYAYRSCLCFVRTSEQFHEKKDRHYTRQKRYKRCEKSFFRIHRPGRFHLRMRTGRLSVLSAAGMVLFFICNLSFVDLLTKL